MLPNLFIAGAQKSGTTSLHRLLESHPDIFFPKRPQEVHFFDIDENYSKGLEWFARYFSDWNGEKIVAQTSPLYIYNPVVPARIHAVLPNARFIFILRNPVERAYSHYWHEVRYGYEILSFEEALDQEKTRISQGFEYRRHYSYVDRGRYAQQISRFLKYFPPENILILLLEELKEDPAGVCTCCAEFLGVDIRGFTYHRNKPKVYNSAKLPRVRQLQVLRRYLGGSFPILRFIIDRVNLKETRYPPMNERTRVRLLEEFKDDIIALQQFTNIDVQRWLK